MHTQATRDTYAALLKQASATLETAFEKEAFLGRLFGRAAGAAAGAMDNMAGAVASGRAAAGAGSLAANTQRRALLTGMSTADRSAKLTELLGHRRELGLARNLARPSGHPLTMAAINNLAPEAQQRVLGMARAGQGGKAILPSLRGAAGAASGAAGMGIHPAAMAAGAAGAAGGAYMLGRHNGQADATTQRNLAFGAGAATGLALPHVMQSAGNIFSR